MSDLRFPLSFAQKGLDIIIKVEIGSEYQKKLDVRISDSQVSIFSGQNLILRAGLYRPVDSKNSKWTFQKPSTLKILLKKKIPEQNNSPSDRVPSYHWPHFLVISIPTDKTRLPKPTNILFGHEAEGIGSVIQSHLTHFFDLQQNFLRNQFQKKYPSVKYKLETQNNGFRVFRRQSQLASPGLKSPKEIFDDALKRESESEDPNVLSLAFEHFQKSADLGHLEAQLKVASILKDQNSPFVYSREQNPEISEFYYKLAAFTNLSSRAAHQLGMNQLTRTTGKKHNALSYFVFASICGSVEAMRYVGMQLQAEKKRYKSCIDWYLMGMRRGDSHCAYKLADLYYRFMPKKNSEQNEQEAKKYFAIAHEWNDSHAIPVELITRTEQVEEGDNGSKINSSLMDSSGLIGDGSMLILSDVLSSNEWVSPGTGTSKIENFEISTSIDASENSKKDSVRISSDFGTNDLFLLEDTGDVEVVDEEEKKKEYEKIEKIEISKIDKILKELEKNEKSRGKRKRRKRKKKKEEGGWHISEIVQDALPYVATWAFLGGVGYIVWRKYRS